MTADGPSAKRPPHIELEPDMRPSFLAIVLGLALGGAVASGDRASAAPPQAAAARVDRSNAGKPAPGTVFTDHSGKPHKLAEFAGKVTVLNLWATWCAPCKAEMPALDRFAMRTKGRINVIAVAEDMQGWKMVDRFFTPGRFKGVPTYLDAPTALSLALKAPGLPVTIAYDARGKELWRVNGPIEWDSAAATKALGL